MRISDWSSDVCSSDLGLEQPDSGAIEVGGRTVFGPGVDLAPERRRIGMVFQDWALFPHLDVAGNVGYGPSRKERSCDRVEAALELVSLGGPRQPQPGTLSGGQQQRVDLDRATAPAPNVPPPDPPIPNQ